MNKIEPHRRHTHLEREDLEELYDLIVRNPGLTISGLARLAGWSYQKMEYRLISLDAEGLLICEDDQGRIYPLYGEGSLWGT